MLPIIGFGLETENQIKCQSDGLLSNNSRGRLSYSSTIQLDAKYRNILSFCSCRRCFLLDPPFCFFLFKELVSCPVTSKTN